MASLNSAQQKEQYSIAFAHAVVAAAGYAFEVTTVDDDSVDFSIRSRQGSGAWARPRLDIQAKCTATADYAPSGDLRYELPLKNYDDLRPLTSDIRIPRLLLVVVVPPDPQDWIVSDPDRLHLHHRGHWTSLAGANATSKTTKVTLTIAEVNRWNPAAVAHLMTEASHDRL